VAAVALGAAATARADDGLYLAETVGVAVARGQLRSAVGTALHLRLGVGMRIGNAAFESWFLSELQTDRTGGLAGVIGGDPKPGSADLTAMGLDAKYIVDLDRHVALFGRAGPLVADGNGALTGYHGRGVGFGGGAQLTGKVRAFGFLWAPLFFVQRGPMATGALFVDAGYDLYMLRKSGAPPIDARVAHIAVGFAIGFGF
jgi:hypothetical protein